MEGSPKKCPNCGLVNPDSAIKCDCGYNFTEDIIEETVQPRKLTKELRKKIQHKRENAFVLEIFLPSILLWAYSHVEPTIAGIFSIMLIIYLLVKDGMGGKSVLKRFLGICVVDNRTERPCTLLQSFLRNVILLVPFIPLIEAIVLITSEDCRRGGDELAGTKVIYDPKE